jgi:hypothetical protein
MLCEGEMIISRHALPFLVSFFAPSYVKKMNLLFYNITPKNVRIKTYTRINSTRPTDPYP